MGKEVSLLKVILVPCISTFSVYNVMPRCGHELPEAGRPSSPHGV